MNNQLCAVHEDIYKRVITDLLLYLNDSPSFVLDDEDRYDIDFLYYVIMGFLPSLTYIDLEDSIAKLSKISKGLAYIIDDYIDERNNVQCVKLCIEELIHHEII